MSTDSERQIEEEYKKSIELVDLRQNRTGEYILEKLIDQAFTIFCNKLSYGGIKALNEYAFQFEFGSILKSLGQLYEFRIDDQFYLEFESGILLGEQKGINKSGRTRIDLLISYRFDNKVTRVAIEIKFFKKKNQAEPNNRYKVFKDLLKLEAYKKQGVEMCYFLLVTNHEHYVSKASYSDKTSDFDIRHGVEYKANSVLTYRTDTPQGDPLTLDHDYKFLWQKNGDFYFLIVRTPVT